MESNKIRIAILDSHPIVREGLKTFLEAQNDCTVIAEVGDTKAALYATKKHEYEVLLLSASISGSDIFEFIRTFKKVYPNRKTIVCYIEEDAGILQEFKECGTDGFIGQNATSGEYGIAVKAAIEGGNFFSENLSSMLFKVKKNIACPKNEYDLTHRELEILSLLANGFCNKEIANQHDISVRTVETHRLNIRRKTKSNTLSQLVRIARSLGLSNMAGDRALEFDEETSDGVKS